MGRLQAETDRRSDLRDRVGAAGSELSAAGRANGEYQAKT